MAGPAWNVDPPGAERRVVLNVQGVLRRIVADAPDRSEPSLDVAARWHQEVYAGIQVPSPSYLGNPRDSDPAHPDLLDYEVRVGSKQGLPAAQVPEALQTYVARVRGAVEAFDAALPPGQPPSTESELLDVVELAAVTHGEWVRIHPYANGNGRVARLWANWVAVRYGLPPFVRVKPRPGGSLYEAAAMASMGSPTSFTGHNGPTTAVFVDLLHQHRLGA